MKKKDWLERNFEETRHHLKAVAYRMLGSINEAEDAVQETWIRLSRSQPDNIENLCAWLTTVVSRVCLDMLRSRKAKQEESLEHSRTSHPSGKDSEAEFLLADAVGPALLVVLDTLNPAERVAFVLHDLFDLSFEEIAPMIDRTEDAARQLASRARRQIRGLAPRENFERQQTLVSAFLAASRDGNFEALMQILHPDVLLRADKTALKVSEANKARGAPQFKPEMRGASEVANTFKGKAAGAQLAWVNASVGAAWAPGGKAVMALRFVISNGMITEVDVVMDSEKLTEAEVEVINFKE